MRDGEPFAIAGLWERCEGEGGPLETCTLLTTGANELLAPHHDRMPMILRLEDYEVWLDGGVRQPELTTLLRTYPHEKMAAYAVSTLDTDPLVFAVAESPPVGAEVILKGANRHLLAQQNAVLAVRSEIARRRSCVSTRRSRPVCRVRLQPSALCPSRP